MPVLRPLRALHYGPDHWEVLDELVSPATRGEPEDRRQVGEVHPLCIRQLIRGERGDLAEAGEALFTHAGRLLARWKEQGVLVRDPRPSFYPLQQTHGALSRRGLVCLVRLSPLEEGVILAHEETAGSSTAILEQQLAMTRCQLSPILAVLPDESGALAEFL
ncbi:MAG: DUF1015 family protein, partial [Myxococcota bacterium]|nr:DUF1015 family protein [Myxococcota bacterium]